MKTTKTNNADHTQITKIETFNGEFFHLQKVDDNSFKCSDSRVNLETSYIYTLTAIHTERIKTAVQNWLQNGVDIYGTYFQLELDK